MENKLSIAYIGTSREIIDKLISSGEMAIEVLPNALTAMNFMKSGHKPDAILCESNVSGGSAYEIFQTLKTNNYLHHIAFILIAFEFRKEVFLEARRLTIDDYYVVPDPEPATIAGRIAFLKEYKNKLDREKQVVIPITEFKMPTSKRLFDLLVSSLALLCLSPLLLIVIIAIRLESKGKVYYTSKRYGRFPFDFYKLRSMRTGADAEIEKLAKEKNQYSMVQKPSEIVFSFKCPKCEELPAGQSCSDLHYFDSKEYREIQNPKSGKIYRQICDYWYHTQLELIKGIGDEVDNSKPCPRCDFLGRDCSTITSDDKQQAICEAWNKFQKSVIAQSKASYIKIQDDPRITKVGKFIRNTSIDELPQLFNVLKGDMSIVGNRPLPLNEAELLLKDSNLKRFLAPAGITGLWQVELRGKGGVMSEAERNRLDNEYADLFINHKYSFWYDLKLILRTVPALFQKGSV